MVNEQISIDINAKDNASGEINKIKSSLNGLKSSNIGVNVSGLDKATSGMNSLVQSTDKLKSGLGQSMSGMVNSMSQLNTATQNTAGGMKILGQNMFSMGGLNYKIQEQLAGTGAVVNKLGSSFSTINPVTGAAVQGFKNLDGTITSTYSNISKATNSTTNSFNGLGNAVKLVGTYMASMIGFNAIIGFADGVKEATSSMITLETMLNTWNYSAGETKDIMDALVASSRRYGTSMTDLQSTVGVIHSLIPDVAAADLARFAESMGKFRLTMLSLGESSNSFRMTQDNLLESLNKGDSSMLKRTALWAKIDSQTKQQMESIFQLPDKGEAARQLFALMDEWSDKNINLGEVLAQNPFEAWGVMVNSATLSVSKAFKNLAVNFSPLINILKDFVSSDLFGQIALGAGGLAAGLGALWLAFTGVKMVKGVINDITNFGSALTDIIGRISGINTKSISDKLSSIFGGGSNLPNAPKAPDAGGWSKSLGSWKSLGNMMKSIGAGMVVAMAAVTAALAVVSVAMGEIALVGLLYKAIEPQFKAGIEGVIATMEGLKAITPLIAITTAVGLIVESSGFIGLATALTAIGAGFVVVSLAITAALAEVAIAMIEISEIGVKYTSLIEPFKAGVEAIKTTLTAIEYLSTISDKIVIIVWNDIKKRIADFLGSDFTTSITSILTDLNTAIDLINQIELHTITDLNLAEKIKSTLDVINNIVLTLESVDKLTNTLGNMSKTTPGRGGMVSGSVSTPIKQAIDDLNIIISELNNNILIELTSNISADKINSITSVIDPIIRSLQSITKLKDLVYELGSTGGFTDYVNNNNLFANNVGGGVGAIITGAITQLNEIINALNNNKINDLENLPILDLGLLVNSIKSLSEGVRSVADSISGIGDYNFDSNSISESIINLNTVAGKLRSPVNADGLQDFRGAGSKISNSINSLAAALQDVQNSYNNLPDSSSTPDTSKIDNAKKYLSAMSGALGSSSWSDIANKSFSFFNNLISSEDENPIVLEDDLWNDKSNSYYRGDVKVTRTVDVNINLDHTSSDGTIDTLDLIRRLRGYTGSIFTDSQLTRLAKDIGRVVK